MIGAHYAEYAGARVRVSYLPLCFEDQESRGDLQQHADGEDVERPPNALQQQEAPHNQDGQNGEKQEHKHRKTCTALVLPSQFRKTPVIHKKAFLLTPLKIRYPQLRFHGEALPLDVGLPQLLERSAHEVGGQGKGEVYEGEEHDEHAEEDVPGAATAEGAEEEEADGDLGEGGADHEPGPGEVSELEGAGAVLDRGRFYRGEYEGYETHYLCTISTKRI